MAESLINIYVIGLKVGPGSYNIKKYLSLNNLLQYP